MRHSNLLSLIFLLGSFLFYSDASANGFDLEVSVSVPNANPAIYTNVPVTVTAKNTGTVAGSGIKIRVGVCGTNAFSFVQQNQLVWTSTGSSATGTWDWLNQQWTIPALAPGQTATLSFTLFTLTTDPRNVQVFTQAANTPDIDSSPGNLPVANGNWVCTDNEDDEAVLTLNGTVSQLPDIELKSFFAVKPVPGGSSSVVQPNDPIPAGTTLGFPDHFSKLVFPVQVPTFTLTISAYLSLNTTVDANDLLLTSGTREISPDVQNYGFTEGYVGDGMIPASTPPGTYYLILKMDATNILAESDETNNTKWVPIVVTAPPSGSIDLALSMIQQTANPVIYSNYQTTLEITNHGQQTATGVQVKWMKPNGVVYTGGNEYVTSKGSFDPNGTQVWNIGSIPANGVESLTVSYFLLQNGAPGTYAQVTAADQTDVDSQPNNGTPPTVNEDDEAATTGSPPPVLTPDLKLSNLVINNSPIGPGQVLTYNFNIANIGNGPASADFNVKAWISTTSYLTSSSIQDGIVPTGNFPAGFEVQSVPGASTLPGDLPDGLYYLLLKVDADETIQESVETNNWLTASFIVLDQQQPGECDDFVGTGVINCASNDANGQLEVIYQPNGELYQATLDGMGQVVDDHYFGQDLPVTTYSVAGTELLKFTDNNEVYRITIPPSLANQYERFIGFTEYQGGYLLFGFEQLLPAPAPLVVIKTSLNFNVLKTNSLSIGQGQIQYMASPLQISPNESAFIFYDQYQGFGYNRAQLIVLDDELMVQSAEVLAQNHFATYGRLSLNPCGQYSLDVFRQISYCKFGSCYENRYMDGHFENGSFVALHTYQKREISSFGIGTRDQYWNLATADGGNLLGTHSQALYQGTGSTNNVIHLEKTLGNTTVWEKDVTVASASAVRRFAVSVDELVLLSEKFGGVFVETLSCLEDTPPPSGCAAITITPDSSKVTIAGAAAPHVLIKVFNPNWTLAFQCLDNCPTPTVVSGLVNGINHVQVKLMDNGWGEICYLEQNVDLSSYANGGIPLVQRNNRQRLAFDNIYPNPAKYWVTMNIYSKEDQEAVLNFYNQQGQAVHRMEVSLSKGSNAIGLDVSTWNSGAYNVIGLPNGSALPAYGRFLKVWEE